MDYFDPGPSNNSESLIGNIAGYIVFGIVIILLCMGLFVVVSVIYFKITGTMLDYIIYDLYIKLLNKF